MKELGRKIKKDFPEQYDDLSDEEVGILVVGKYPHLAPPKPKTQTNTFERAITQIDSKVTKEIDNKLDSNVQQLIDKYNPGAGLLSSLYKRFQAGSHAKYLESLNEEQRLAIEQAVMMEKAVIEGRMRVAEFNTFIANNANTFIVLEAAAERKLSPAVYDVVTQAEELARIEMDRQFAEQRETIRLALLSKDLAEQHKLFLIQGLLDGVYKEIHGIEAMAISDSLKARMIEDREETIKALKEDKSGRENRLLQANNGQDVQGDLSGLFFGERGSESD